MPPSFACSATSDVSPAIAAGRKNILLIVSDDHGYCHYGFMGGSCIGGDRPAKDCRSDVDCPGGSCQARTSALGTTTPLRVNEYTCRYRQPPSRGGRTCFSNPDRTGSRDTEESSFGFNQSWYPCTGTNRSSDPGIDPYPEYPLAVSPHVDALASTGTVFLRAHVGGNACKSSRPTIHFGKHQRHLKESAPNDNPPSIAFWLEDVANYGASAAEKYTSFLVGKGEVITETKGGFNTGVEGANALAKFKCKTPNPSEGGAKCRSAATYSGTWTADPTIKFPAIPYEARAGAPTSVQDVLQAIEGVGRPGLVETMTIKRVASGAGACADPSACDNPANCTGCTATLEKPFFAVYAPNLPHKRGKGKDFERLYYVHPVADPISGAKWIKQAARVTEFDLGVGALVDELKRHCVCGLAGTTPTPQSLWEHTVVILLSDHGYHLPMAKGDPTENTHRTALIINEPRHRTTPPQVAPRVVSEDEFFANSIDVLKTAMAYANTPADPTEFVYPRNPADFTDLTGLQYPFARNLQPWVEGGADGRAVGYGESATQGTGGGSSWGVDTSETRDHYLIPRPGEVGVCYATADSVRTAELTAVMDYGLGASGAHVKPCLTNDDCTAPGSTCHVESSPGTGSRCINAPGRLCATDAECHPPCAPDTNSVLRCQYDPVLGSFGDLARPQETGGLNPNLDSATCTSGADCVPVGVKLCRPPLFKLRANGLGVVTHAWDLRWDPDERRNLMKTAAGGDSHYFGVADEQVAPVTMIDRVGDCLEDYWHLNLSSNKWERPATWRPSFLLDPVSDCPSGWAEP
jgi:hypothetical protein